MDGFLNLLKPRGVTSHDIGAVVRRMLREKQVGHLGTLDPLAVGVLPLAIGAYRRLSEYFWLRTSGTSPSSPSVSQPTPAIERPHEAEVDASF